jgi:alkyl sulfatase BDS1-like metallo-beta-lactamase superfamily hydrolase
VTVMTPLNIELTKVTQTTVTRTIAVVPLPGVSRCSAEKVFDGPLMGRRSSARDGVSLPLTLKGGLAVRVGRGVSG